MGAGEHSHQLGNERKIQEGNHSNVERPAHFPRGPAELFEKILDLTQNGARMLLKNVARGGKQDPFSAPLKKINPQDCFQVAHLLGNIRLRNPQPIGRPAETAGFGHGEEITQVANFERIVSHRFSNKTLARRETQSRIRALKESVQVESDPAPGGFAGM
jgi:hypothetical protein